LSGIHLLPPETPHKALALIDDTDFAGQTRCSANSGRRFGSALAYRCNGKEFVEHSMVYSCSDGHTGSGLQWICTQAMEQRAKKWSARKGISFGRKLNVSLFFVAS
jgi:hypothetical protein